MHQIIHPVVICEDTQVLQYFFANQMSDFFSVLCAISESSITFQNFPPNKMAEDLYKLSWQQFRENITANFRYFEESFMKDFEERV